MTALCACCEQQAEVSLVRREEVVNVRGEAIPVEAEYYVCASCGGTFENTRGPDPLEAAYREYRRRHSMLQPEEIRQWRKSRGLTQKELSAILGWGSATLSRYENGALQEEAHEKLLRLAMAPQNLLRLIKEKPGALPPGKREQLIQDLEAEVAESCSWDRVVEERLGRSPVGEFSGYRPFDYGKFVNAVLFFCRGGQMKTKLNKLLFYADFKHFKEHAVSITGARYAHLPHGPVPDRYETLFAIMVDEGLLALEEVQLGDYVGENVLSVEPPDLGVFSDSELKVLTEVKAFFQDWTATKIREFSHREEGYRATAMGRLISYRFAERLQELRKDGE
ncbi:type II TA system antitoxin MqsA family protein [Deferrisoma sp.]